MAKQVELRFGNPNPQVQVTLADGSRVSRDAEHLNQSVTTVTFAGGTKEKPGPLDPDHVKLALSTNNDRFLSAIGRELQGEDKKYALALNELEQIVAVHTGGSSPTWVACEEDPDLERVAAKHFECARGEPTALFTNAGRDALHAQHLGTSAQPAAFNYMALTASVVAPAAGDTTLTGEITTAGGGLIRKQATYAHTVGTNTSTLTATFTANGSDSLPVTIAQIGVFNAASVGTLSYHTALNATATLTTSGDNLTVTETVTAG